MHYFAARLLAAEEIQDEKKTFYQRSGEWRSIWFNSKHARKLLSSASFVFSSPEPKAQGELIVWDLSRRPSVRPHFKTLISLRPAGQS